MDSRAKTEGSGARSAGSRFLNDAVAEGSGSGDMAGGRGVRGAGSRRQGSGGEFAVSRVLVEGNGA